MRKTIETIAVMAVTFAFLSATHLYIVFYSPASQMADVRVVNIQKGASFRVVASSLEEAGVIRDAESFIFAANVLGAYKKVQAGEYELKTSMTPLEVLDYIVKGKVRRHMVTIPEGYNIREIASVLKEAGLADEKEFVERAADPRLASNLGVEGETLEGYLFPDTYIFSKGMSADEMIVKMVEKFKAVYYPEMDSLSRAKGVSMRRLVTLASIIEKETGAPEERALVSAVFHNRLRKGIRLQSDPTVIYGIKEFDGNIRKSHLTAKSPYNTYVNYGLPPGPIANPGKESLMAALNPAKEDYLYFVSRNDGTHHFSKSLQEHNRAVNMYQRSIKSALAAPPKG